MSNMSERVANRVYDISEYMILKGCTVREAAKEFHVSKSTAYRDLTDRLSELDSVRYALVNEVLQYNKIDRAYRGGRALKFKLQKEKDNIKKELLKGRASFSINRNDLYWKCSLSTYEDGEFEWYNIKLWGYNDSFWWDNVSEKASIIPCVGSKGTMKKFKLNYNTLEVIEVK